MIHPQRSRCLFPSVLSRFSACVALGVVALVAGCATVPALTPITDPTQRYQFRGFSVLPPQPSTYWYLISPSGPKVKAGAFARQVDPSIPISLTHVQTHTIRAVVISGDLGAKRFNNPEGFVRFVEQQKEENPRFRVLESKHIQDTSLGEYCVRSDVLVEDHGVPGFAGSVFYMVRHVLNCIHPDYPNVVVQVGYSQRAASKSDFKKLDAEGEPFIQSLQFTKIP